MSEERYAYDCLVQYTKKTEIILKEIEFTRIDQSTNCEFNIQQLINGEYIDMHSMRPYNKYNNIINHILEKV